MRQENAENPLPRKPKLLDRAREVLRAKYSSLLTEEAYIGWMRRFIFFDGKRRSNDMEAPAVAAFLTDLAVRGR